ncbi:MAG: helix-turn-helix domain-containing protein [Patescibacteria group bacterium]|nr:helix-turn-helix domain-containing protein [Patescibacteria group bacterium]
MSESKIFSMNKKIDKLFTIEEIAEILRVSTRSVNRYIDSGKLKGSKIGSWRIKESDLNNFLESTSNFKKNK